MFRLLAVLAAAAAMSVASATVYMKETFDDDGWSDRWTVGGEGWGKTLGEWKHTSSLSNDADKGIQTGEDARHYSLTAPLDSSFDNTGKDLVVGYTVRHEQNLDCGGAYIKLLPEGVDAASFSGDSDYAIMFGPDVCGSATRKTHAIFTYKGNNLLSKKTIRTETDNLPHRFTLIVHPDNTFAVEIDGEVAEEGSLYDNWDFLAPKQIDDPEDTKPEDWEDDAEIPDPEDEKPEGWDDVPEFIPDPDAEQPEDWDEEEDGEWEAPMVSNPEYKGEWKPKMIPNPNYKGVWKPRQIDNPDFEDDDSVYAVCGGTPCAAVGFELWQVKAGTVFDDIIVTDSVEEARAFEKETFEAKKDAEKEAYEAKKEEERKKEEEERKRAEEERKAAEEDEDDDEDEEDEEL